MALAQASALPVAFGTISFEATNAPGHRSDRGHRTLHAKITETERPSTRIRSPYMANFLIEVPHPAERVACLRAIEVFLRSGSHFLTHADWGCGDGEHKAWIVVEVGSRDEARGILPPAFRSQARIVQLNAFSMKEIEDILSQHAP